MNWLARSLRAFSKAKFRLLGRATIKDIPTEEFNTRIVQLMDRGWSKGWVYSLPDAWIDYGSVRLKKDGVRLKFEWDNWTEGSVEGPAAAIEQLASEWGRPVLYEWRWSEYDDMPSD